jgi:nicotinate-nucleotide pyrophosphorylase
MMRSKTSGWIGVGVGGGYVHRLDVDDEGQIVIDILMYDSTMERFVSRHEKALRVAMKCTVERSGGCSVRSNVDES